MMKSLTDAQEEVLWRVENFDTIVKLGRQLEYDQLPQDMRDAYDWASATGMVRRVMDPGGLYLDVPELTSRGRMALRIHRAFKLSRDTIGSL